MSKYRFKQACRAWRLFPGEADSLSNEASRFQIWLFNMPNWIQKKAHELYDSYSDMYSEIDLDLVVKQEMERYIRGVVRNGGA